MEPTDFAYLELLGRRNLARKLHSFYHEDNEWEACENSFHYIHMVRDLMILTDRGEEKAQKLLDILLGLQQASKEKVQQMMQDLNLS